MTYFSSIYKKLFPDKEDQVLSHETLKRSARQKERLDEWLKSREHEKQLDKIYHAYHMKLADIKDDIPVVLFRSPYANGFAIRNNDQIPNKNFPLLMDYFKIKVKTLGYRQAGSNKKVSSVDNQVITIEKYYLKPPLQVEPPISQLYGNIALELHYFNDIPNYLKLTASIYSDRMYKPHLDFQEMVEKLFGR